MKRSTDYGRQMPRVTQQAWLDFFAAECEREPVSTLTKWLTECPEDDPAYPIIRTVLARKLDAAPVFGREDDLSCFDGPAVEPDEWESWDWDRLREQRRIEFVADQYDPAEEGL